MVPVAAILAISVKETLQRVINVTRPVQPVRQLVNVTPALKAQGGEGDVRRNNVSLVGLEAQDVHSVILTMSESALNVRILSC